VRLGKRHPSQNPSLSEGDPFDHPTTAGLCPYRADHARGGSDRDSRPGRHQHRPQHDHRPYVLPVGDGVSIKSLLTVGDGGASNGYQMVGIPDGLGILRSEDGSRDFELFMNQELRSNQGAARRHGKIGAFVSELEIDSDTYQVEEGRDAIDPDIRYWDYVTQTYRSTPSSAGVNPRDPTDTFAAQLAEFSRFCSSTISEWKLYNPSSEKGYKARSTSPTKRTATRAASSA